MLGATPKQIAGITMLQAAAFPLLGMVVAAIVEHHRKRLAMAFADVMRFLVMGALPVLYFLHHLTIGAVAIAAGVTAVLGVIRDVAAQAYVPRVLPPERIARGNAKLELSNTAAQSLGPALGGMLMHLLAAPFALFLDAFSYLGSAATLLIVREPEGKADRVQRSVRADIWEGLQFVIRHEALSRIAYCSATLNLAGSMVQVTSLLYFYRTLHLAPLQLGILLAVSNVGFAGVILAPKLERKLGMMGALAAGIAVLAFARFMLPLASLGFPLVVAAISLTLASAASPVYNIVQLSYRQRITPMDLQARMHATMRTINSASAPAGAALGGLLATGIGIRATLFCAAVLTLGAAAWFMSAELPASARTAQART